MVQTRLAPNALTKPTLTEGMCAQCMGHRHLCGINPCPILLRAKSLVNIQSAVKGRTLFGSSPPGVFVGEFGYPKVLVGPLVPPILGDETAIMEKPDLWLDKTINDIISMRFSLVRTKAPIPVDSVIDGPRFLQETQALALSERPTDSEAVLIKKPTFSTLITGRTLPLGPSAPLDDFVLEGNPSIPRAVDRITSDTDANASTGILELFQERVSTQHITRLFSIGLVGEIRRRRLVPTRWSITAVDDIIGKQLHKRVLHYPMINDYEVYSANALGNTVVILLLPTAWQYEALECWLTGANLNVIQDDETYKGRSTYASSVVGAYYAARLPILEVLDRRRRQAGVIAFLETDPKIWVPLGVWRFRSLAKRALEESGKKFSTLEESLDFIRTKLHSPLQIWLNRSRVYERLITQTTLDEFL